MISCKELLEQLNSKYKPLPQYHQEIINILTDSRSKITKANKTNIYITYSCSTPNLDDKFSYAGETGFVTSFLLPAYSDGQDPDINCQKFYVVDNEIKNNHDLATNKLFLDYLQKNFDPQDIPIFFKDFMIL